MVELRHVSFAYEEDADVLRDVTFSLNRGEFCFVIGDSGSGKSTLSKLLTGELAASSGEVIVNGYNMGKIKRRTLAKARRTIGMVYQDFRLVPTWTVWENLEFAMICVGANTTDISKRIPVVLELVSLDGKSDRYPRELSGGEQQRVAIARAIINHPNLLVADEPTGNLDPKLAQEIMGLFYKICDEEKIPTIVITHAQDVVENSGRRIVKIKTGKILEGGKL